MARAAAPIALALVLWFRRERPLSVPASPRAKKRPPWRRVGRALSAKEIAMSRYTLTTA
jgi:hypothetical protein